MRLIRLLIRVSIFLSIIPIARSGESEISKMVGTYAECFMACKAIRINPDLTFDHYLSGDLWPTIRLKGTLKLLGNSMVLANSYQQPSKNPTVKETTDGHGGDFQIRVIDAVSATYPGIHIVGKSKGTDFDVETDNNGIAIIPPCGEFSILIPWLKQSWQHKLSLPGANKFEIQISEDQMFPERFIVNEKWAIKNKALYSVTEDGKISEYGMERVNKRRERDFFPDK
jgi:hypothetical protein